MLCSSCISFGNGFGTLMIVRVKEALHKVILGNSQYNLCELECANMTMLALSEMPLSTGSVIDLDYCGLTYAPIEAEWRKVLTVSDVQKSAVEELSPNFVVEVEGQVRLLTARKYTGEREVVTSLAEVTKPTYRGKSLKLDLVALQPACCKKLEMADFKNVRLRGTLRKDKFTDKVMLRVKHVYEKEDNS